MPPAALDEFDMRSSSDVFHSPTTMEKCVWNVKNRPLMFLVILLLVATVIGALIYFTTDLFAKPVNYEPLEFQKLMSGGYEPHRFNGTWISDDEILMKDVDGHIVLFNVNTLNKTVLAENTARNVEKCFEYNLSANKRYLLLAYHYRKVYRHSYIAHFDVIDVTTGEQFSLKNGKGQLRDLQLAKWSPVGQSLAIVDHYNIFYMKNVSEPNNIIQLTSTGGYEFVNGIPDWVYEEEVFGSNSALWFSEQAQKLAYASFDDTAVPTMPIPFYGVPGNMKYQYTSIVSVHYPKVGVPNPTVRLFVQNLNQEVDPRPILVEPPKELTDLTTDIILNTVVWSDDTNLFVMWMNRVQNESQLVHYVMGNSAEIKNVIKFAQPGGWLDFTQIPLVGNENHLAIINPVKQSNGDYFRHVVVVESNGTLTPVTSGNFEVLELLKWDVESDYIYYLANTEANSEEQYMYRVSVKNQSAPECMTCKTSCKFNRAEMSFKSNFYTLICSGPNVPEVAIFKTTGEKLLDWEMNTDLKKELEPITLPRITFIDVPLGDNFKARVKLILPPSVDENSDVKYPMLVNTYAGPGSNLVLNKFSLEWNMYFSSSKNVIVAQIDGRGSGRRGNKNLFANYRKLGTYEIDDQIFVASYLQDQFSFIDKSKTAIWGWSYGGYTSGMALTKDAKKVFKCGLSVAPVTDWIYYDTIYTERYMGLLEDNAVNYRNASLMAHAENMRNKNYMLIHGTYDDNVHYQQSMMLSYELEKRVILFRQQSYPDESHGLSSVRQHVYQTISSYLLDCFNNKM